MIPIYRYSLEKPSFGAAFLFVDRHSAATRSFPQAAQTFLDAQGNAISPEVVARPSQTRTAPGRMEYPNDTREADQPSFQKLPIPR
jgi:hypothetical protein